MKHIYFVRHGESETNRTKVRLGPGGPLSERGRAQAQQVAQRVVRIDPGVILTSSAERAVETARIIAEAVDVPVETIAEGGERKYPSELLGKHADDPVAREVYNRYRYAWEHDTGERISDEETFAEFKDRVDRLTAVLAARGEERLVVVSHHLMAKMLLGLVLVGPELSGAQLYRIYETSHWDNAGVTYYTVDEKGKWTLVTWNDNAHLG